MAGGGESEFAVALVHHPVLNRWGEVTTTAVTSMDVHDFARTCAFFAVSPVYFVHPSPGMHALVRDIAAYWLEGEGGRRNPGRKQAIREIRMAGTLEEVRGAADYKMWYTSAAPPSGPVVSCTDLCDEEGPHLLVFGTGWGLAAERLPPPNGWLSPITGPGKVRHLSVRAALAIYLDRLRRSRR